MTKTQANCPQCHQPVVFDLQQIFDLNEDPLAKQKILSGTVNFLQCQFCGFGGLAATPIVYHDPEKELLLTYFPPELSVPLNEQEKQIGPLINKVINGLPAEKRKAYVLQPQSMLTYQTLLEKILGADGITREMLEEQQKRVQLLQRMLTATKENLLEIIQQEKELIDVSFFSTLSRLIQAADAQGEKKSIEQLSELQNTLFENTEVGKEIQLTIQDTETAIKAIQDAGKDGLTREKLLDIVENTSSDTQLSTIVGLARAGMDYNFFQILSDRIDSSTSDEEKERLKILREKLLNLTEKVDKKIQEEFQEMKDILEKILSSDDIEKTAQANLSSINELFIQLLESELSAARKNGDLERINKLERVMILVEKAIEPPKEIQFLEALIHEEDEEKIQEILIQNKELITPEFMELLNNIVAQSESTKTEEKEGHQKILDIYRKVLKFSMQQNISK